MAMSANASLKWASWLFCSGQALKFSGLGEKTVQPTSRIQISDLCVTMPTVPLVLELPRLPDTRKTTDISMEI